MTKATASEHSIKPMVEGLIRPRPVGEMLFAPEQGVGPAVEKIDTTLVGERAPRYEMPLPLGWFCVAYSDELAPGQVVPLRYFGEDLVMFRTESGTAHVMDAHCPHLGAHLGYGGSVQGESIVCPFHGWVFNGSGECVDVPYASRKPTKVAEGQCLYSYPTVERNRMIWAWYHPQRAAPSFEVEEVSEATDPQWTEYNRFEWSIRTVLQEAAENGVDTAHFVYVHSAAGMPKGQVTLDGPRRCTDVVSQNSQINEQGVRDTSQIMPIRLVTKNCGPGQTMQWFYYACETVMIGTVTPIDKNYIHLRFAFTQPKAQSDDEQVMAQGIINNVVEQVGQDIPIWEHKKYQPQPALCNGDGPIAQYRKWFKQFYVS